MQSGCYMVVKPVYKLLFFMADPASSKGTLRHPIAYRLEKGKGSEQGIVMTVLACRHVFSKLLEITVLVIFAVNTVFQKELSIFVGKFFFR